MALPGHRRTSSDKRRRAAHFFLKKRTLAECAKCGEAVRPHHACAKCGTYAGREALDTSRDIARAVKRAQTQAPPAPAPEEKEPEAAKETKKKASEE